MLDSVKLEPEEQQCSLHRDVDEFEVEWNSRVSILAGNVLFLIKLQATVARRETCSCASALCSFKVFLRLTS